MNFYYEDANLLCVRRPTQPLPQDLRPWLQICGQRPVFSRAAGVWGACAECYVTMTSLVTWTYCCCQLTTTSTSWTYRSASDHPRAVTSSNWPPATTPLHRRLPHPQPALRHVTSHHWRHDTGGDVMMMMDIRGICVIIPTCCLQQAISCSVVKYLNVHCKLICVNTPTRILHTRRTLAVNWTTLRAHTGITQWASSRRMPERWRVKGHVHVVPYYGWTVNRATTLIWITAVKLYSWIIGFRKVVRRQISGEVVGLFFFCLISALSTVPFWIYQGEKYYNCPLPKSS